jgi:hypothetical protein
METRNLPNLDPNDIFVMFMAFWVGAAVEYSLG